MKNKAQRFKEKSIAALEKEKTFLLAEIERRQNDILAAQATIEAAQLAIAAHHDRIVEIKNDLTDYEKIDLEN